MLTEEINILDKLERYQFTAYVGHITGDMNLLGQYETAINIIIKDLKSTKTRIDVVSYPVLYMMRHSLELGYKRNFEYLEKYSKRTTSSKIQSSHNLEKLHSELKVHVDIISNELSFDKDLIQALDNYYNPTTEFIKELKPHQASSFRYTKDNKGINIFDSKDQIDIGSLKQGYDKAVIMLAHLANVISPYTDYKDLMIELPNFKNGTGIVNGIFPTFQMNDIADMLHTQYEGIDQLSWKISGSNEILRIITVKENCYLVPMKQ